MSATIEPPATAESTLEKVRALLPGIRERAMETERERSIPPESAREFLDAGLARILMPKRFGGSELGLRCWVDAIMAISAADASHGWCASLLAHHPHYLAQFPIAAQEAVWSDGPDVWIAAPFGPVMETEASGDGYRVSGEASWASGVNHSSWILTGSFLVKDDLPDWTLFLIAPDQYEVRDTWHTTAMRGTGSNTVVLRDVYVPKEHTVRVVELREGEAPGGRVHSAPWFRSPWMTYAPSSFVAVMLGAARGALDEYIEWNANRYSLHGGAVAQYPSNQVHVGRASAQLDAAQMLVYRCLDVGVAPEPPTLEVRARCNRDAVMASELIVSAMQTVVKISGAAVFGEDSRIARAWRDVHFAANHVSLNPESGFGNYGRERFGIERDQFQQFF